MLTPKFCFFASMHVTFLKSFLSLSKEVPRFVRIADHDCRIWCAGQSPQCSICRISGHRACPLSGLCRRCRQPGLAFVTIENTQPGARLLFFWENGLHYPKSKNQYICTVLVLFQYVHKYVNWNLSSVFELHDHDIKSVSSNLPAIPSFKQTSDNFIT